MNRREMLTSVVLGTPLAFACSRREPPELPADPLDSLAPMWTALEPVPHTEFEIRAERLREQMRSTGFDAFITEAGPVLEYFCGIRWGRSERPLLYLITAKGKSAVIAPAFEGDRVRDQLRIETSPRVWEENEDPYQLASKTLREFGAGSGKVAVDGSTRLFVFSGLQTGSPATNFLEGSALSEACRLRKTPLELDMLQKANLLTKQAYPAAFAGLEQGMKEADLGRRIAEAHSRQGARGGALVLFGPNSALPHGSRYEQKLEPGSTVLVDGGCSVNGYQSDVTRTVFFGKPSDLQRKVWNIVWEAQEAALAAARPGITCSDLDRTARKVIEDRGYGPGFQYFTHRLGHGIGLEGHEPPYIVQGNEMVLESGMAFSIEPGIYLPGQWGVRIEDIVVIREDGAEVLGERALRPWI